MAKLYKVGEVKKVEEIVEVSPANGKAFTLEELQGFVAGPGEDRGTIDIQELPKSGMRLVLNDNGKNIGCVKNNLATELWKEEYPIADYPFNNDELIVGTVLVASPAELGEGESEDGESGS